MYVPDSQVQQTIIVEARSALNGVDGCSSVPGFSAGDIDPGAKYLLFGQYNGTTEFPQQFGNVICDLSRTRALTIALDWPTEYSQTFSNYISDAQPNADDALLALPVWDKGSTDGRSSAATLRLLQLLRRLRLAGRDIEVTAFIPSVPGDQNDFEAGIAGQLEAISAKGRLVVALMGSLHATKQEVPDPRNTLPPKMIDPAADRLPKDQVISIHFESKGGTAWGLGGPHKVPVFGGGQTLWSLYANTINGFDGRLFIGGQVTASAPYKQ